MIREFGALFGATIVGCGSLYSYGQFQDLQRNLAAVQKDRDMLKISYEFQTQQRQLREKEVKDLQEKLKGLEADTNNNQFAIMGLSGILGIGAAGIYALTKMR